MVLQADVSLPRVILINHIKLVSSTARALIGLCPFVNVHPRNLFAIELTASRLPSLVISMGLRKQMNGLR